MTTDESIAIVLLGRGGVARSTTGELTELAKRLLAQWPGAQVLPAFIDRWQPDLPAALTASADAGAQTIVIMPLMLPDEAALRRWLHKVAMRWLAARGNGCPRLVFAEPLSQTIPLPALLAEAVRSRISPMCPPSLAMMTGRTTPRGGPACQSIRITRCGVRGRAVRQQVRWLCGLCSPAQSTTWLP